MATTTTQDIGTSSTRLNPPSLVAAWSRVVIVNTSTAQITVSAGTDDYVLPAVSSITITKNGGGGLSAQASDAAFVSLTWYGADEPMSSITPLAATVVDATIKNATLQVGGALDANVTNEYINSGSDGQQFSKSIPANGVTLGTQIFGTIDLSNTPPVHAAYVIVSMAPTSPSQTKFTAQVAIYSGIITTLDEADASATVAIGPQYTILAPATDPTNAVVFSGIVPVDNTSNAVSMLVSFENVVADINDFDITVTVTGYTGSIPGNNTVEVTNTTASPIQVQLFGTQGGEGGMRHFQPVSTSQQIQIADSLAPADSAYSLPNATSGWSGFVINADNDVIIRDIYMDNVTSGGEFIFSVGNTDNFIALGYVPALGNLSQRVDYYVPAGTTCYVYWSNPTAYNRAWMTYTTL